MAKTVLVIEDEEAIRSVIRAFLEDAGYTVVQAADGEAGVAQFRACRPDLVLLDVMLPKLDGFAVCKILRQESRTPILMLTALDDDDNQLKGFDALADDYIAKPFSMPVVLKRIEAVLRPPRARSRPVCRAGSRPRRGRLPHGNILGSCTRYRVFVGEAYMPPGRGSPSRGGCGKIDRLPRFVGRGLGPAAHYYF